MTMNRMMDSLDRVYVRNLPCSTLLIVQTRNSSYRIVVLNGSNVWVEGGEFFPQPTSAHLDGATVDGNAVAAGWIRVGLPMQITAGATRFVTSPISSIVTRRSAACVIA